MRSALAALALLLAAPSALATVAVRMDVESVAAASDLIVIARVETVEPRLEPASMALRTHATLLVERTIAGPSKTTLHVSVLGGELEGRSIPYPVGARFRTGERVLVFLERRKSRVDEWLVTGAFQGMYRIETDRETGLDVAVRDRVRDGVVFYGGGSSPEDFDEPVRLYVDELEARVRAVRGVE
jgi:hypothetical protein